MPGPGSGIPEYKFHDHKRQKQRRIWPWLLIILAAICGSLWAFGVL